MIHEARLPKSDCYLNVRISQTNQMHAQSQYKQDSEGIQNMFGVSMMQLGWNTKPVIFFKGRGGSAPPPKLVGLCLRPRVSVVASCAFWVKKKNSIQNQIQIKQ